MRGTNDAAPQRNSREGEGLDPKFVNADRCCHDVDDGIGGADFMEMDTVDGDAVNLGFGLRQARENLDTRVFDLAA